jgi:hypothetical protein
MKEEDIIRMAKQAGGHESANADLYDCFIMSLDDLERFCHHAAAVERDKWEAKFEQLEALMQVREQQPNKPCCLAEREACAKVCDDLRSYPGAEPDVCAAEIRARGKND